MTKIEKLINKKVSPEDYKNFVNSIHRKMEEENNKNLKSDVTVRVCEKCLRKETEKAYKKGFIDSLNKLSENIKNTLKNV